MLFLDNKPLSFDTLHAYYNPSEAAQDQTFTKATLISWLESQAVAQTDAEEKTADAVEEKADGDTVATFNRQDLSHQEILAFTEALAATIPEGDQNAYTLDALVASFHAEEDPLLHQMATTLKVNAGYRPDNITQRPDGQSAPLFDWKMDVDSVTHLVGMLGIEVIAQALAALDDVSYFESETLHKSLKDFLSDCLDEQISALYSYIVTQLPTEHEKEKALSWLVPFISDETIRTLVTLPRLSPWLFLTCVKRIIAQLKDDFLAEFKRDILVVSPEDIKHAFHVAERPDCDPTLREDILVAIARTMLSDPAIQRSSTIVKALNSSDSVQARVRQQTIDQETIWDLAVGTALVDFKPASYHTFLETAQVRLAKHRVLQDLTPLVTGLPMTAYQRDASLLVAVRPSQDKDTALAVLSSVHEDRPETSDAGEETKADASSAAAAEEADNRAKTAVLLEALCLTDDAWLVEKLFDRNQPFNAHLATVVTPDVYPRVMASLPLEAMQQLQDTLGSTLSDHIHSSATLRTALQGLTKAQCDSLLQRRFEKGDPTSFIPDDYVYGLLDVLAGLNDEQRASLLRVCCPFMARIMRSDDVMQLRTTLSALRPGNERTLLLQHLPKDFLKTAVYGTGDLKDVLPYLNPTELAILIEKIKPLGRYIHDIPELAHVLEGVNEEQCRQLLSGLNLAASFFQERVYEGNHAALVNRAIHNANSAYEPRMFQHTVNLYTLRGQIASWLAHDYPVEPPPEGQAVAEMVLNLIDGKRMPSMDLITPDVGRVLAYLEQIDSKETPSLATREQVLERMSELAGILKAAGGLRQIIQTVANIHDAEAAVAAAIQATA